MRWELGAQGWEAHAHAHETMKLAHHIMCYDHGYISQYFSAE